MGVIYWTPLCTAIGVINLAVFLLERIFPKWEMWGRLVFHTTNPEWFQYVTSLFMHQGWLHLTTNAFFLFAFGAGLEKRIGQLRLLAVYLIAGACGCLVFSLLQKQDVALVGASGAIFGIICSMVFLDPKAFVMIPGAPLPLPILLFALLYVLTEIVEGLKFLGPGIEDKIAHTAHVGGGLAGGLVGRVLTGIKAGSKKERGPAGEG